MPPTPTPTPTPNRQRYTYGDVGGCDCCGGSPCTIPPEDLSVSTTFGPGGTVSLVYLGNFIVSAFTDGAVPNQFGCVWQTGGSTYAPVSLGGGNEIGVQICTGANPAPGIPTCTEVLMAVSSNSGATWTYYFWSNGCSALGPPGNSMSLGSYTCSPLSVAWTTGTITFTLTV